MTSPGDRLPRKRVGSYELLDELGRGGAGCVYRARHITLGKLVAVKLLERESESTVARFIREARLVSQLVHPNVVQVHDVGQSDGTWFIVMDLVPGGRTLAHLIEEAKRAWAGPDAGPLVPVDRALAIASRIARAIAAAHARGIVHRDLKPQNVLLGPGDEPLVTDFGLARQLEAPSSLTSTGVFLGTLAYVAPEQSMGARPDERFDVYGIGGILRELLCGSPPNRERQTVVETLAVLANRDVEPLGSIVPSVPSPVEAIVAKALARDPARRYPSAEALADDLDRARARADEATLVARPSSKRAVLVALAFGVVASIAGLWLFRSRATPSVIAAPTPATSSSPLPSAEAERALHENRLEDALVLAGQALERDPANVTAAIVRALADFELGRMGHIEADLRLKGAATLARLKASLAAGARAEPEEYPALEPWVVLYVRGRVEIALGDFEGAQESARRSAALAPWNAATRALEGVALVGLGDRRRASGESGSAEYHEALACLDEASRRCRDLASSEEVRHTRAIALMNTFQDDAAIVELEAVIALHGIRQWQGRYLRAQELLHKKDLRGARDELVACARHFRGDEPELEVVFPRRGYLVPSWWTAALCDLDTGNTEAALDEATRALSLEPTDEKAIRACLVVLKSHPGRESVASSARRALEANPADQVQLALLGCAEEASGNLEAALEAWKKLRSLVNGPRRSIEDRIQGCSPR